MWKNTTNKEIKPEQPKQMTGFTASVPKETTLFDNYFRKDEKPKAFVTLFFGDTASGKTFVAMDFPPPIFVIDTESRAINTKYEKYKDKEVNIFEPKELKTEFDPKYGNALDVEETINKISQFVIDFANKVKRGEIKEGTVIFDTTTDIWSLIQDWGMRRLEKYVTKQGGKKADAFLMKINNQFDWGPLNKKHEEILGILRTLIKYNIHIVFTARERSIPDYIKEKNATVKDKIRAQKDVPFLADVIFHLKRVKSQNQIRFWSECIKLGAKNPPAEFIESLNYEKIKELLETK